MVRLFQCWGIALFVGAIGLVITVRLAPTTAPGRHVSEFDQAVRISLPWIIASLLMAVLAGALYRDRSKPLQRLLGVLLMPVLLTLAGTAAGYVEGATFIAVVTHLVTGGLGAVLGLGLANLMSGKGQKERLPGYW
jgi:hypothetical protein